MTRDRAAGLAFRRAAGRWEAGVTRIVAAAVRAGRRSLKAREVRRAGTNTGRLTMALLPYGAAYAAALLPIEDLIQSAFLSGYRLGERRAPKGSGAQKRAAARVPDAVLAEAVAWAERYAAELIVDLSAETRQGIRLLVAQAFRTGIPAGALARLILAQTALGLTGRQMSALILLRARLVQARPGTVVQAGSKTHRIPKEGATEKQIADWTDAYGARLLAQRAATIARTVTIRATAAGQLAAWERAIAAGVLGGGARRRWTAAPGPKTCRICETLNGQARGFGEWFETVDGVLLLYPPAHPNCRCSVVLAE